MVLGLLARLVYYLVVRYLERRSGRAHGALGVAFVVGAYLYAASYGQPRGHQLPACPVLPGHRERPVPDRGIQRRPVLPPAVRRRGRGRQPRVRGDRPG